jgi:hypothetical protein
MFVYYRYTRETKGTTEGTGLSEKSLFLPLILVKEYPAIKTEPK